LKDGALKEPISREGRNALGAFNRPTWFLGVRITVVGVGKGKHDAVKHTCEKRRDDSVFCCATKPGSGATKNTEKEKEQKVTRVPAAPAVCPKIALTAPNAAVTSQQGKLCCITPQHHHQGPLVDAIAMQLLLKTVMARKTNNL